MNEIPLSRRAALAAGLAATALLAGCMGRLPFTGEASESVEREFDADEVTTVSVVNLVGDVSVTADDVDSVRARVEKRARSQEILDELEVTIELTDGQLTVETSTPSQPRGERAGATVTVVVPEDGPEIEGVATLVGDASLSDTRGDTVVTTKVGDVSATGVDGFLALATEVGTVTASEVRGLDAASTDVGDLKVDLLATRDDVSIDSRVGDIAVGVADDLNLDVIAESNGGVDSDLSLTESTEERNRLTGQLNDGGDRLRVHSDVGDVSLRAIEGRS